VIDDAPTDAPELPGLLPIAGQPRERCDAVRNRRRILAAARELVAQHGAEGLSMNALAAAAGVGKGTIFRRFGDRDGLLYALLDEGHQMFVPNRGPSLYDVALDSTGALFSRFLHAAVIEIA